MQILIFEVYARTKIAFPLTTRALYHNRPVISSIFLSLVLLMCCLCCSHVRDLRCFKNLNYSLVVRENVLDFRFFMTLTCSYHLRGIVFKSKKEMCLMVKHISSTIRVFFVQRLLYSKYGIW